MHGIHEVELLAIGAGPANLALAVALEELAPDIARESVIIEQYDDVAWQRGMLLPWSKSQVSFLKDLVTLRNPRSRFSFVNHLHAVGRLDDFVNLGSFTPYRVEISDYLRWVAGELTDVRVQYGRRATSVEPRFDATGEVTAWSVHLADGDRIDCRTLVVGAGRDANIPQSLAGIPRERLIHSTEFSARVDLLDADTCRRAVVVGGAQSAAEMLWTTYQQFPKTRCTMIMRSIGLNCYESSKFTNELFYPSFVDEFHAARPEARDQMLREMHRTNYAGLAPDTLDVLYRQLYLDKLTGVDQIQMMTMTDITDARIDDDEVVLTLLDRRTGTHEELRCDVVLLGTGFIREMPAIVRDLARALALDDLTVTRGYRLELPDSVPARCYLQGVNEATHGIADSLLSLLAARSAEIVGDLLAADRPRELLAAVPTPR